MVGDITIDAGAAAELRGPFFGPTDDSVFTSDFDSRDAGDFFDGGDLELITVEIDGSWYVSPFLSAGHAWVESAGLPSGDFDLVGEERPGAASDPVAAVERYYDVQDLNDASQVAEVLGGGEGRFFHVFADALDVSGAFDDSGMEGYDAVMDGDVDYTLTELDDGPGGGQRHRGVVHGRLPR